MPAAGSEDCGLLEIFLELTSQRWAMNDRQFRLTGQIAINGQPAQ